MTMLSLRAENRPLPVSTGASTRRCQLSGRCPFRRFRKSPQRRGSSYALRAPIVRAGNMFPSPGFPHPAEAIRISVSGIDLPLQAWSSPVMHSNVVSPPPAKALKGRNFRPVRLGNTRSRIGRFPPPRLPANAAKRSGTNTFPGPFFITTQCSGNRAGLCFLPNRSLSAFSVRDTARHTNASTI